jgi:hypothetical protein
MSADEMTELDHYPFVLQNFTPMLQKIMQEDGGTWEALGLMDQLKITSPGFDYHIKKDQEGCWFSRIEHLRISNRPCHMQWCLLVVVIIKSEILDLDLGS